MSKKTSDFGKGLTYCIGLFLAHADRVEKYKNKTSGFGTNWPEMWFNGASDHCYELDISTIKDRKLHQKIEGWKKKVFNWGHGFPKQKATEKDVDWALNEAKKILRIIDERLLKTTTIKGKWE